MSVWVKDPRLKSSNLIIISKCLLNLNKELVDELSKKGILLTVCPEEEMADYTTKIATIIKCSKPESITIVTNEGSPHCYLVHAYANQAVFITGSNIPIRHYVVVGGGKVYEVLSDSIRIARYLHLVDKLVRRHPDILAELEKYSIEYKMANKLDK